MTADDAVIGECDLLGTNLAEFYGRPPPGKSFRVPVSAVFFFADDRIVNERHALLLHDDADLRPAVGKSTSFWPDACARAGSRR